MHLGWKSLLSQGCFNNIIEHLHKLKEDERISFTNPKDKLDYLKEFDEVINNDIEKLRDKIENSKKENVDFLEFI